MKFFKFISFCLLICAYFIHATLFYPFLFIDKYWARKQLTNLISFYSRAFLHVLQIKVNLIGDFEKIHKEETNYLIVSNHLSYIDILILASQIPASFVTSTDIKNTPFLGQIVTLAGCLFVNRQDKSNIKNEIKELREALYYGLNVVVFPEATSTNGNEVIRFRHPLFEASVATGRPILPLTLNYSSISQTPITKENRDLICWYGDMGFFSHFLKLLDQSEVVVDLNLNDSFLPSMLNSMEAALKSHKLVSQNFKPLNQDKEQSYV